MLYISTIIYFGEVPIGYEVFTSDNIFNFRPAIHTQCGFLPPEITASSLGNDWIIKGLDDGDIKAQVYKIIELNPLIHLPNKQSAAS
jgi:hypothetical protein